MSKKNITVLQVLPALESGGVEKGTLEVAKFLVEKGHRSIVISKGGRLLKLLIKSGSEHLKLDIGKKSLLTLKYIPVLIKFIKINNIDIIHVRSRFPAWIIYFTLKFISKKISPPRIPIFAAGFVIIIRCARVHVVYTCVRMS